MSRTQPPRTPCRRGQLLDLGLHAEQFHWNAEGATELGKIISGQGPMNDGITLNVPPSMPEGAPIEAARERFEEFAPGLDADLLAKVQEVAEAELAVTPGEATGASGSGAGLADKVKDKLVP